jgi:hypothetical protein
MLEMLGMLFILYAAIKFAAFFLLKSRETPNPALRSGMIEPVPVEFAGGAGGTETGPDERPLLRYAGRRT